MPFPFSSVQRATWKQLLELRLRRAKGDMFQDFFGDVMEKCHGTDFIRVKAAGRLGDKKCDGYLLSKMELFQCYGADDGGSGGSKNRYFIKKMNDDYAGAAAAWDNMTAWHMTHNFVGGLSGDVTKALADLKKANGQHEIAHFGPPKFEVLIFGLEEHDIVDLLGPSASEKDFADLQLPEISDIMNAIVDATPAKGEIDRTAKEVPTDKLEFNKLPYHHCLLIEAGMTNAPFISDYIASHPNPMIGEKVAHDFKVRYTDLKTQNLSPEEIMDSLYEFTAGQGAVKSDRTVAAWSLLAYLFEACSIFEDHPSKVLVS